MINSAQIITTTLVVNSKWTPEENEGFEEGNVTAWTSFLLPPSPLFFFKWRDSKTLSSCVIGGLKYHRPAATSTSQREIPYRGKTKETEVQNLFIICLQVSAWLLDSHTSREHSFLRLQELKIYLPFELLPTIAVSRHLNAWQLKKKEYTRTHSKGLSWVE